MADRATRPRLKGFRFPREIIAYAVWAYHNFAFSTANVEDLLAERGVTVSREAIRLRVSRFGAQFARPIRRDRTVATDGRHIDEVVIAINVVSRTRRDRLSAAFYRHARADAFRLRDNDAAELQA